MDRLDQQAFSRDFVDLKTFPDVVLQMSAIEAWCLMATIQLACRHPEFTGPTRELVEPLGRLLQSAVAQTAALAAVAAAGWDSRYDEKAK